MSPRIPGPTRRVAGPCFGYAPASAPSRATPPMSDAPKRRRALRWMRLIVLQTLFLAVLAVALVLLIEGLRGRALPPLQVWQERVPESEFTAKMADGSFQFDDYIALEDQLFVELDEYLIDLTDLDGHSPILRYVRGGPGDPATFTPNWNRTVVLEPDGPPVGGALLLHGLTDSPYSMRSIAERLRDEGYLVIALRLPAHGTVPAALLTVTVDDWMAAVEIAWAHLRERVGPDAPMELHGYSNGGALATLFTLERLAAGEPTPDRVVLLSPAIGITRFAAASNMHKAISWMPWFSKSRWLGIEPEYDPFKYNSFPKNAGAQSWALEGRIERGLNDVAESGALAGMPPVLTFQSVVDATVLVGAVVHRLYGRLPENGSELVLFDVNTSSILDGFYREPQLPLEPLLADPNLNYDLVVVGNENPDSLAVTARFHPARSTEVVEIPLERAWPRDVYSLAHVAIPFPPDDVLYGSEPIETIPPRVHLGRLDLRGERHVLLVSAVEMMRLRHNPFHELMIERIVKGLKR